jgi:hypothetical protein
MASPFHTLFLPHHHNNQKAKLLWTQSLLVLIGIYLMGLSFIDITTGLKPGVLGYASQIDTRKIIELTNSQRENSGSGFVVENAELTAAAQAKANDMFANNYWAHISPSGTEPWYFVSNAGYKYQHAGENLARDFSNPKDVVSAWMASPTHKQNLLDRRYKDIGVAVKDGYINGVETTIVVQMFGTTRDTTTISKIAADSVNVEVKDVLAADQPKVQSKAQPETPTVIEPNPNLSSGLSPLNLSKVWSMSFVILILGALAMDWIFVLRYNLIRLSGKTWAHLTYMFFVGIAIFIIQQGIVL